MSRGARPSLLRWIEICRNARITGMKTFPAMRRKRDRSFARSSRPVAASHSRAPHRQTGRHNPAVPFFFSPASLLRSRDYKLFFLGSPPPVEKTPLLPSHLNLNLIRVRLRESQKVLSNALQLSFFFSRRHVGNPHDRFRVRRRRRGRSRPRCRRRSHSRLSAASRLAEGSVPTVEE